MSLLAVQGGATGTGTVTLLAPVTNTNQTLTLPDATGTVQVSGAAISGTTGTFSGIVAANGGGVQFPATQVSSADANTLDDYEEGTWTPAGNGVTYTGASGKYTKIGDFVFCSYALTFPSTASTSGAQIQGLPFTIGSQPRGTATVSETNSNINPIMMALSGSTAFIRDASNNDRLNVAFSSSFLNGMIIYRV
jgi:hypothetical protein